MRVSKKTKDRRPAVARSGAVGRPATTKALDLRADLDALLRKAFPANLPRWYTCDGSGGGTYLPNGMPDGDAALADAIRCAGMLDDGFELHFRAKAKRCRVTRGA